MNTLGLNFFLRLAFHEISVLLDDLLLPIGMFQIWHLFVLACLSSIIFNRAMIKTKFTLAKPYSSEVDRFEILRSLIELLFRKERFDLVVSDIVKKL